jgi:ABC-type phosphate transport system substrate-binding protein
MRLPAPSHRVRLLAMLCLSLLVACLAGCQAEQTEMSPEPAQPASEDAITAAGSSFAAPLFKQWFEVYAA